MSSEQGALRDERLGSRAARRGLVASAMGLCALALTRLGERVAHAADGSPMVLGQSNNASSSTSLSSGMSAPTVVVNNTTGAGVFGQSGSNAGIFGYSGSGQGTVGQSGGSAPGVFGTSASGVGVYGNSPANGGVYGNSDSGFGVSGNSGSGQGMYGNSSSNIGVLGRSGTGVGVYGLSASGQGIIGESDGSAPGVFGQSSSGPAVYGYSAGYLGVYGNSSSGTGVYGASSSGYAGQFQGAVLVNGSFSATGIKSAVVPLPDGSHRRVYCQESPESYFEDFGVGRLLRGQSAVPLDPDFAAIVRTDDYAVFVTPEGDCSGLYVTAKSATGFEVRELQGGTSTLPFRYRIVAKRRDIAAPRLQRVAVPSARAVVPPVQPAVRRPAR